MNKRQREREKKVGGFKYDKLTQKEVEKDNTAIILIRTEYNIDFALNTKRISLSRVIIVHISQLKDTKSINIHEYRLLYSLSL